MGKRLTKEECSYAAKKLDEKSDWATRVKEAKQGFLDKALEILKAYLPKGVWQLIEDYGEVLAESDGITICRAGGASIWLRYGHYWEYDQATASYKKPFRLPMLDRLKVSDEDYKQLADLDKAWRDLERQESKWIASTAEALYKLNSRTRIQEAFPEALPYLCFDIPANCTVQVYNYEGLRQHLK